MDTWDTDILLAVFVHLPVESVLALRTTCKAICAVTRLRPLWAVLFRRHVLDQRIPCVRHGADVESLTHRALALRKNWTAHQPVPRNQRTIHTAPARVIFLQFLPGRSNRWLISVCMTARPRWYRLQCWDLAAHPPRCVAELVHADGPYGGVVLNADPDSRAVLALQSAQTETLTINFEADDPECAFETDAAIDGRREIHLLDGTTLVTRSIDDGALSLWDLADPTREKIHLLNPSLTEPDDRVRAVHLAHDYALVVRTQSVEIYSTTPRPTILPTRGAPLAYPLAQFKFQWPTDHVVLCPQHVSSSRPRPIHLCVRFGSMYPWPVNVLHHYLFLPNPAYRYAPTPSTFPSTTEYNLPYDPRPTLIDTISSPVRLFGQSAMTLGPYGTALWLDNHTEEMWGGPSEHGQRLAGTILHQSDAEPSPTWSGTEMVFGVRHDDTWTRITMDEEAGRIAIGHTDGAITLFEY